MMKRAFVALALTVGLSACAPEAELEQIEGGLRAEPVTTAVLPRPFAGDRLEFDSGSPIQVLDVDGDRVEWKRGRRTTYVATVNPFLPAVEYRSSRTERRVVIEGPPDALWPLEVGKTASYTEERFSRRAGETETRQSRRDWNCEVAGKEIVDTGAGRFDTFKVVCENPDPEAFFTIKRAYQWWYAPAIGHIVKERYERFRQAPRTRTLAAFHAGEPRVEDAVFAFAFQDMMEKRRSGETVSWDAADGSEGTTMKVVRTYKEDGRFCRDATVDQFNGVEAFNYEISACRTPDGVWVPPQTTVGVAVASR